MLDCRKTLPNLDMRKWFGIICKSICSLGTWKGLCMRYLPCQSELVAAGSRRWRAPSAAMPCHRPTPPDLILSTWPTCSHGVPLPAPPPLPAITLALRQPRMSPGQACGYPGCGSRGCAVIPPRDFKLVWKPLHLTSPFSCWPLPQCRCGRFSLAGPVYTVAGTLCRARLRML